MTKARRMPGFPFATSGSSREGRGSAVLTDTRTATPTATAAHAAFWALHGADYDHTHLLLITRDNKQVAAYRYGSRPGEPDYIPPGATLPE